MRSIEYLRYRRSRVNVVSSKPGIRLDLVSKALRDASKPGHTHHLYVGNAVIWEKIKQVWKSDQLPDRVFIRCRVMVETIRNVERQKELTGAHHQGKTNHRGVNETLQALRRRKL